MERIELNNNSEVEKEFNYKDYIVSSDKVNNDVEEFLSGKIPKGYKIGVEALDNHFVCKNNEFYVLTGKKGRGKTTVNQALQIPQSIVNGLIWVVAFKENSEWSAKLNYMNYALCEFASDVKKKDLSLYNKVSDWIDEHFIFIDVDDIKTALDVTQKIIESGKNVHAVVLDPINSFKNGWQDTGNGFSDGSVAAINILNFTKKFCSVHISQHPVMSAQRQQGRVTSYQGEGGWFLNKASFTWVIDRESGSSENQIIVENVRNKHTGGGETDNENPVVLHWSPTKIDISYQDQSMREENIIAKLVRKYNPFKLEDNSFFEEEKQLPKITPQEAFKDEIPF
jgi:energy-coupling factor transporter ATP-binding protein EcfA2